jgi:hypothetical protein
MDGQVSCSPKKAQGLEVPEFEEGKVRKSTLAAHRSGTASEGYMKSVAARRSASQAREAIGEKFIFRSWRPDVKGEGPQQRATLLCS